MPDPGLIASGAGAMAAVREGRGQQAIPFARDCPIFDAGRALTPGLGR
jgi:hypothetical protein